MRHLLLLCVASALLAGADAAPTVITVDQLPPSLRSRLSQEIAGGTIVDVRVDERSGDPQYIVRYRNQGTTTLQTLRLGQTGKVLDSGLIASPDHPDGSIGTPTGAAPQTMPVKPTDGPTPAVPPLPGQGQANRNATGQGQMNQAGGMAQPAIGSQPNQQTQPNGDGSYQNTAPGIMQTEKQSQLENPPFPAYDSQRKNTTNQGSPKLENPPLPTDGSQPNGATNQGTNQGSGQQGGSNGGGGSKSH